MTDIFVRKQATGEPGNGGEFGTHAREEASVGLLEPAPHRLRSEFIDSSQTIQEAAAIFAEKNDWAQAEDFENELFDTWDTTEEYERDVQDPASELVVFRDNLIVENLPGGGVAVFWG